MGKLTAFISACLSTREQMQAKDTIAWTLACISLIGLTIVDPLICRV